MDAVKFFKEQSRMCSAHEDCAVCPLGNVHTCWSMERDVEQKVKIVEEWSKDHPVKTRLSELQKIFPKVVVRDNGLPIICPSYIDEEWDCIENCEDCKIKYWLEEIE